VAGGVGGCLTRGSEVFFKIKESSKDLIYK